METLISIPNVKFRTGGNCVIGSVNNNFNFEINRNELERIGRFKVRDGKLLFSAPESRVLRRLKLLLSHRFLNLRHIPSGHNGVYIREESGIPLIGSLSFGIIDRNTNCLEVRPITGCNLNCIYCSVSSWKRDMNQTEYVVEKDYLVKWCRDLVDYKGCKVDVHIGAQGEPLLYQDMNALITGLRDMPAVRTISLVTNGTLLTEKRIRDLAKSGLDRLDVSINALDNGIASRMAGSNYNTERVVNMIGFASRLMEVFISPIYLPGINDNEIPKLIKLSKRIGCRMGIQNFLQYRYGQNPVKPLAMKKFNEMLAEMEKKYKVNLVLHTKDFGIEPARVLPKPFKKGNVVKAQIVCPGRHRNEMLGIASDRCITVTKCNKRHGNVNVKITRTKHNVFYGRAL